MRQEKAKVLLELARHLAASAEGMTLDEMAASLAVSRRTVERMRDAVWEIFPQLEEINDPPTKRFRIRGGLDGFFQAPTTDEMVELAKAADALRNNGAVARAAALNALERKIKSSMRASVARRVAPDIEALVRAETIAVQAGPQPYEDPELIGLIRESLKALRALRFEYMAGTTPGRSRDVVPYGITFGRSNYLVGAEIGTATPRSYRLSRIRNPEILDLNAAAPVDFNLRDFANQSFGVYQGQIEEIVLRILPAGREDALSWRFHPSQSVEHCTDGCVIVRFAATGMLEVAWHLFTWENKVQILAPEGLKATMRDQLQRALRHHTTDTDVPAA